VFHTLCSAAEGLIVAVDLTVLQGGRFLRRQQLPEEVASYVRELIISGAVQPGEYLRMEGIAQAVGVSNTPVREGLLLLRSEGFVTQIPRRGFVVAPFTRQDIKDLFWAQAVLSGELAARAATRITPEQIGLLENNFELYERAVAEDDASAVEHLGHEFHREINRAAGSRRLALLLNSVVKHVPNRFYAAIVGQVAGTRVEHPLLMDAFREKDVGRARTVMEQHISAGADRLIEMLEERGLWTADLTF
jgi:DNA-binding GntR family transcriptional regulator